MASAAATKGERLHLQPSCALGLSKIQQTSLLSKQQPTGLNSLLARASLPLDPAIMRSHHQKNDRVDNQEWTRGENDPVLPVNALHQQTIEALCEAKSKFEEAERMRQFLESKILGRQKNYEDLIQKLEKFDAQKNDAEARAKAWGAEVSDLRREFSQLNLQISNELSHHKKTASEKGSLLRRLQTAEMEATMKTAEAEGSQQQIAALQNGIAKERVVLERLQNRNKELGDAKTDVESTRNDLEKQLEVKLNEVTTLKQQVEMLSAKASALASMNGHTARNMEALLQELAKSSSKHAKEHSEKERILQTMREADVRNHELQTKVKVLRDDLKTCREALEQLRCSQSETVTAAAEAQKSAQECMTLLRNQLDDRTRESTSYREELAALATLVNELEEEKGKLLGDISKIKEEDANAVKALERAVEKGQADLKALQNERHEQNALLNATTEELKNTQEAYERNTTELNRLQEQHQQVEQKLKETNEQMICAQKASEASKREGQAELETKQLELQRHLREISMQNNQAVAEIRKHYEAETHKAIKNETQKASELVESTKYEYEKALSCQRETARTNINNLEEQSNKEMTELAKQYHDETNKILEELRMELCRERMALCAALEKEKEHVENLRAENVTLEHKLESELLQINLSNEEKSRQAQETFVTEWKSKVERLTERKVQRELELQQKQGDLEHIENHKDELMFINDEVTTKLQHSEEHLRTSEAALEQAKSISLAEQVKHEEALSRMKIDYEKKIQDYNGKLAKEKLRHEATLRRFSYDVQRELIQAKFGDTSPDGTGAEKHDNTDTAIDVDHDDGHLAYTGRVRSTMVIESNQETRQVAQFSKLSVDAQGGNPTTFSKQRKEAVPTTDFQQLPEFPYNSASKPAPPVQQKIASHEYQMQVFGNGKKVSKRRRSRSSTVVRKDKTRTPADINELFACGSLNPYQDDPYAID